tara:strand:- start:1442 stop:1612 length:171 start_codon:yes stop_codon:yes gene_type:complete
MIELLSNISWINYPATFLYDMTVVLMGTFIGWYLRSPVVYLLISIYFGLAIWYQTT